MSCGNGGSTRFRYTGNQVGFLNETGLMNFCSGGTAGSGLAASTTTGVFTPNSLGRRPWLNSDAQMNDNMLDACYPNIGLRWIGEIQLGTDIVFRFSNQAFYVNDSSGASRFYDARAVKPPVISVDVGEWLSPKYKVSDLQMSLNNRDGYYNQYLPYGINCRQWAGSRLIIKIGFGEMYENYFILFDGQISDQQGLETTRDTIDIRAYDRLAADEIPIPTRTFSSDLYPDIDANSAGKVIPLVYGDWTEEVDAWGNVQATCTNGLEVEPDSYNFKISDAATETIKAVYLHRGDRNATNPLGPIALTNDVLNLDLANGEFNVDANTPCLDEAHTLLQGGKCAQGTTTGVIASDGTIDFLSLGVKAGDYVTNTTDHAASVTKGNLQFISLLPGASGETISVRLYLRTPDNSENQNHCTVDVSGHAISVGIPQSIDSMLATVRGADKASQIKSAILNDSVAKTLIQVKYVGQVPVDIRYDQWTKPSGVHQDPFSATFLSNGQAAEQSVLVTAVANFQLTIESTIVFAQGDQYDISTIQYAFLKDDKLSVICKGKPVNLLSTGRLSDVSASLTEPTAISIGFDGTYWIADDATQAIYNLTFKGLIVQTILYTDIDASIVHISGIAVASDGNIWATDPDTATIYRYDYTNLGTGLSFTTADIVGLGSLLTNLTGISVQSDNRIWFIDQTTGEFYLCDSAASIPNTAPTVVRNFNSSIASADIAEILDLSYDEPNSQLTCVDRTTNTFYRLNETTGAKEASFALTDVSSDLAFVSGVSVAQDGTLFFVDAGTLGIYNYNDLSYASVNPCFIARDIIQSFGAHTYDEFDLNWNFTARQLSEFKSRIVINAASTAVTYLNSLLKQFNIVFSLRFNKFSLFWIEFNNFRANGRLVKEKDIKEDTFVPKKEMNQYFNSAKCTYATNPFAGTKSDSDTYVSTAGIAFHGGVEVNKKLDMFALYKRADIDKILPLYVKLAVPEPEFITTTFGFRIIRSQIQDTISILFSDDAVDPRTGIVKKSGRRFDYIPAMIRSIRYTLETMEVQMKLWSLGTTEFPGYTPTSPVIGGVNDEIVLTNLGRIGRVSPMGTIIDSSGLDTNQLRLDDVDAQDAEHRDLGEGRLAWLPGYKIALVDGSTKEVLQTLTVDSVTTNVITFVEDIDSFSLTAFNGAGFTSGGTFIQYANYDKLSTAQKLLYASFSNPTLTYPDSRSNEVEEQRAGLHNFADGGLPYVLYPRDFVSF